MKIDFSKQLHDLDGKPLPTDGDKPVTLSVLAVNALLTIGRDENVDGAEKYKRYELARKIHSKDADFTVEEVALVKKLIGQLYTPLAVGQAWKMLDA